MKIYNDAGKLSEEGKKATEAFTKIVKSLVNDGQNDSEKRVNGAVLANLIGDIVAEEITKTQ